MTDLRKYFENPPHFALQGFSLTGTLLAFDFEVNMKQSGNRITHWAAKTIFVFCFLWHPSVWAEHLVDLQVSGIKNEKLNENVQIYTNAIEKEDMDGSDRYQESVRQAVDKGLRAFGYYESAVSFELKNRAKPNKPLLIAHVTVGNPVKIAATDVVISGQADEDPEFAKLERKVPKPGTVLNHETYDDYKSSLQQLALTRGYFDAGFETSRLEVMPSTYQAWWKLHFNSKARYHYGKINFQHAQIREDYLRNMLNIQPGEDYLLSDLSTLTNNYSSTNWFNSVLLQPHLDDENKLVDLDVLLYPRKKNIMSVGVGYSTDVGPRLQWSWTKPWINARGHSVRSNMYISSPKQTLELTYKHPLLKNPLNYYYEYSAGFENENTNDTKTTASTLAALRYWNHPTGWQYSLGLRVRHDSFTQAEISDKTLLIYPTTSLTRTRLRGGAFPDWGDSQRITFDFGRKFWLSDVDFWKIQASTAWIRTYAQNHRFLTRLEAGVLNTASIHRIPPSLRFFAGGDRSVRGYGYKKISPKDRNGKLIGGSRLLTGSIEYQYQVYPDWWLATFVDSGLAANSFDMSELRYGTGVGVRWASPVGAIKFDIATPVRDKDNSKNIQFYIGLGSGL
ncbi:autotransporter assembly complex protein TamA [Aggregatibacter actinomycetemcomitans]|uniref:autotransporter assembly complex protein TamA n=1 Tax=Aggregatibacter actinomycetemcomitans TaxID=714 RepID=UPI0006A6F9A2|nr:autotransporter assembly complex family protein [Aggregatibacter actinomycetemcomitans]KOE55994.1 membrane protein [Aggregatibacter actinomycetemcomitans serotype b str. I23C]KOE57126.1 membrane protein [Aggregatibacter actinomycetemcomitans serotype b str. S23A]